MFAEIFAENLCVFFCGKFLRGTSLTLGEPATRCTYSRSATLRPPVSHPILEQNELLATQFCVRLPPTFVSVRNTFRNPSAFQSFRITRMDTANYSRSTTIYFLCVSEFLKNLN